MEPTSLAQILAGPAAAEPAIIAEAPAVAISHRALSDQVERLAKMLCSAGLRPGDAVALVLPNGVELLVLFLAITRAGLIAVPLNPASKTDELRIFLTDVEARAVIATSENAEVAAAATGILPGVGGREADVPVWMASVEPSGTVRLAGIRPASGSVLGNPSAHAVA